MSVSSLMIHECNIERESIKQGDLAAPIKTFIVARRAVACRVQPTSTRDGIMFGQRGWAATHSIQFDEDPGLDMTHRVVFNGQVYEFRGIINWQESDILWTMAAEFKSTPEIPPVE